MELLEKINRYTVARNYRRQRPYRLILSSSPRGNLNILFHFDFAFLICEFSVCVYFLRFIDPIHPGEDVEHAYARRGLDGSAILLGYSFQSRLELISRRRKRRYQERRRFVV